MRRSAVVVALFLVAVGVSRLPAAPAQEVAGWTTLFDGSNLNHWTMTGNANWRLADGIVEADTGRGYLVVEGVVWRLRFAGGGLDDAGGQRRRDAAHHRSEGPGDPERL